MVVQNSILKNFIYWVDRNVWLLIALGVGLILFLFQPPSGLTLAGWRILIIVIITLILIIAEPIPIPGIAFLIILLQVYFGISDSNSVSKAFMNDAVFFIMGSLMLAVAIIKQGWDTRIALGIVRLTGDQTYRIGFGFAVISAFLSSFIGSHTVVAIMLPIALTMIRSTTEDKQASRQLAGLLLFSIAYGCMIGSVGTPSGGGRNAIMLIYWREYGIQPISYWSWMVHVYPLVILELPLLYLVVKSSFKPEYLRLSSGIRRIKIQVAKSGPVTGQQKMALVLFLLVFIGWILLSDKIGLGMVAITGVVLYLITGLVKWEDINRHVNWGVVLLFGAAISLGVQIKNTGAAEWIVQNVLRLVGDRLIAIPLVSDAITILLTSAVSNLLSSSASVAVLAPITLQLPGDTVHMGLITVIASSFGYMTTMAAPACVIIYSSGLLKSRDFLRVGWKMGLVSILALLIYANTYWRLFS